MLPDAFAAQANPQCYMDPELRASAQRAVRMGLLLAERSIDALLPP